MLPRIGAGLDRARDGNASDVARAFSRAMASLAPFEPQPELAIAVSGGADSMALALLADEWARARGGRITALTVDHGLRPEAAAEARRVGRWLKAAGIRHRILRWSPDAARDGNGKPRKAATQAAKSAGGRMANLQAAARDARYALLCGWCRAHRVLHLLLAHHRDDQAETVLLRLARGSGLDGLAGMAPLVERDSVRLLRPLLDRSKTQLAGFLAARGQDWIEDPSNRDAANARVRMRRLMPALAREGLTPARLAETAQRLAQARIAIESATTRLLGEAVALYPEGYLRLDTAWLRAAEREVGLRALSRIIACIGGGGYGPRLERLTRLYESLTKLGDGTPRDRARTAGALGRGATLGGCRIVPAPRRDQVESLTAVLVLREPAALAPPVALAGEEVSQVAWDGRFLITVPSPAAAGKTRGASSRGRAAYSVGALGEDGLRQVKEALARGATEGRDATSGAGGPPGLPRDVIIALPALRRGAVVAAVPHLGYRRERHPGVDKAAAGCEAHFVPLSPLTKPGFTLV